MKIAYETQSFPREIMHSYGWACQRVIEYRGRHDLPVRCPSQIFFSERAEVAWRTVP